MRIVLAADGSRGDVHPLLALAARLRTRGHAPLVCGPPDFETDAAAAGVPFAGIGEPAKAFLRQHARLAHGRGLAALVEGHRYIARNLPRQLDRMVELATGADLVVAAGAQTAAASAAEAVGARYRYLAYCPTLFPSREHAPAFLPAAGRRAVLNRALWAFARRAVFPAMRPLLNRGRARHGLRPVSDPLWHLLGREPLLAADPRLAPLPADVAVPVARIPCLHGLAPAATREDEPRGAPGPAPAPVRGDALPPKLEAFLAAGPPPVYVGFGSMPDPNPPATTRLVLEAVERAGVRALLSRGWARLGGAALPEGVLEIGPVPHGALFPRVAAVVHHAGAGTTHTAARAGVPQIAVPHVMDQFWWSRRLEELGLAAGVIRRRELSAARLAAALRAAVEAEVLAVRARELAAELRRHLAAAPEPADVVVA